MVVGRWNRLGVAMVPLLSWVLVALLNPARGVAQRIFEPVVVIPGRVTVANMPNGTLVMLSTQKREKGNDLIAKYSDDGLTWSEPTVLRRDFEDPGATLFTRDGEMHSSYSFFERKKAAEAKDCFSMSGIRDLGTEEPIGQSPSVFFGVGRAGPFT